MPVADVQVQVLPRGGEGGGVQKPAGHLVGQKADQHDQGGKAGGGEPEAGAGVMRGARVVAADGAEEALREEAEAVADRDERAEGCQDPHRPGVRPLDMGGFLQHQFLGEEPVQGWNSGHGQRGDGGNGEGDRHQGAQTAKALQVAGVGLVVDDPGGHEKCRLEGGVVHDVEEGDGARPERCRSREAW